MKACHAKGCTDKADRLIVIHNHYEEEPCDPYDLENHIYYEFCKEHLIQWNKDGPASVPLKE